jgi:hypothetical protein
LNGGNVDLDLLSLFPQMRATIMEGLRDRTSFWSTMEKRESKRSNHILRKKEPIYSSPRNMAFGASQNRLSAPQDEISGQISEGILGAFHGSP